ncbi:MAG: hypothetical protein IT424_15090 [Pirellulales bacterium]|nr:hypothetical protein [Pirellulales bacterium]
MPRIDRRRPPARRPGMALYVAVSATATIVSVLALTSMAVVRLERKQAQAVQDRFLARSNARSAVELALKAIGNDPSWRTAYGNNVETSRFSAGPDGTGTLSWKLIDSDGSIANADAAVRIKGIGRVGTTVQASSVQIRAGAVGPTRHRSQETPLNLKDADVRDNKWWAQYFKPSLPASANGWNITSVQIYCRRESSGRQFSARLYRSLPFPAYEVDSATLISDGLPSFFAWYTIPFAGATWFNVGDAVLLSFESASNDIPLKIKFRDGGVSDADSYLVQGDPSWKSYDASKALLYRINGYYTTSSGVTAVPATWLWDAP